jgi:lauroyl/myristoyl acyltransferase
MIDLESLRYWYLRRIVTTGLGAIGESRSRSLATALARGVFDLRTPGRRTAEERLSRAFGPSLPPNQRDAIILAMYEHIARFWIEAVFLRRMMGATTWRKRVTVVNETVLRDMASSGRGCILATCYFGNPAVAAFALGQIFRPVYVLVDLLVQPVARAWQDQLYRLPYVRTLVVDEAAKRLPYVLERGGAVMLVVEHRRLRGGVDAEFLGESVSLRPTSGKLSTWYHAPLLPVLCRRRPRPFEFELWVGNPAEGDDAETLTRRILQQLEKVILSWPEQYLWSVSPTEPTHLRERQGLTGTESGIPARSKIR